MDPVKALPKEFLHSQSCVKIPPYQRKFDWDIPLAHQLVRDVAEAATKSPDEPPHWVGVIIWNRPVVGQRCDQFSASHTCREVIDGQQRLTTILLWAQAVVDYANQLGYKLKNFLPTYSLQQENRAQLHEILSGEDVSRSDAPLHEVYTYFRYLLWLGEEAFLSPEELKKPLLTVKGDSQEERWKRFLEIRAGEDGVLERSSVLTQEQLEALLNAVSDRIGFLALEIEHKDDDATAVFDALNGQRTRLSQFDHLRNFCFQELPPATANTVFTDSWEPCEKIIQGKKTSRIKTPQDHFLYNYLISLGEAGRVAFNQNRSFLAFRRFHRSSGFRGGMQSWIEDDLTRAVMCWSFTLDPVGALQVGPREITVSKAARRMLRRIRIATEGPAIPIAMFLLNRACLPAGDSKSISSPDLTRCLQLLEGVLYKTLMGGKSLTNLRREVMTLMGNLQSRCVTDADGSAADKFCQIIRDKQSSFGTPTWASLSLLLDNSWNNEDPNDPGGVYGDLESLQMLAVFDAIEEQSAGVRSVDLLEKTPDDKGNNYTIDHVFPQTPTNAWKAELRSWHENFDVMRKQLHRIGNLAPVLSKTNSKMMNKVLAEKQKELREKRMPSLHTCDWTSETEWTQTQVDKRTGRFIDLMKARWPD
jgi:hypothetical protein